MKYINKKSYTKLFTTSLMAALMGMSSIPQVLAKDVFLNTRLVSHFNPVPGYKIYSDVWGEGNLVTLGTYANGSEGVFIIDITDPTFPVLTAHYNPVAMDFRDVKIKGGIGYFSNAANLGVHVVDLSTPTAPLFVSEITSADNGFSTPHNIFLDGDFLYQASGTGDLVKVFNIANPAAPAFVRDIQIDITGNGPHDITVVNNRLYISNYGIQTFSGDVFDGTTDIIDVTNVGDAINFSVLPSIVSFDSGPGTHNSWVTADGNTMAVGREIPGGSNTLEGDIRIYDNSLINPTTPPTLLATVNAGTLGIDASTPHNVVISGDRAFVSWYQAGLQVLDISNPSAPVHVGSYDTFPGSCDGSGKTCAAFAGAWGIDPFLADDKVLVSDMNNGLFIIDASRATLACQGDVNDDGSVDQADVDIWDSEIRGLRTFCSKRNPCQADVDGDGDVDKADLNIIATDFGRTNCPIEYTNEQPVVTITSPLPTSPALQEAAIGASINFTADVTDAEDRGLTNSIVWESSLDGIIGAGGDITTVLSPGMHTVRASVTDSGGELGADFAVVVVTDLLVANSYTTKGKVKAQIVDLSWTAGAGDADIYRDGAVIATVANNGAYSDNLGSAGSATYEYQVCEAGTSTCSNTAQVVF